MSKLKCLFLLVIWLVNYVDSSAQYSTIGLDLDGDIVAWYDGIIGPENSEVLEGRYYKLEHAALEKSPYFKNAQWAIGVLDYDGQTYTQVSLLYNVNEDLILIRNTALQFSTIQPTLLHQQKVDGFTMYDRQFVHLVGSNTPSYGSGFYEELFAGDNLKFYIKRIKNEYVRSNKVEFMSEDKYFLFDGQKFVKYMGKKSLYKTFPELKSELKSFGGQLNTNLKKGEEDDMIKLLTFCDKLLTDK